MNDERNYRAYCYFRLPQCPPEDGCGVVTGRLTLADASRLLADMSTLTGYTGGGIDHRIPGIGWVVFRDETECHDQHEDS